jgi:hypothetical protein
MLFYDGEVPAMRQWSDTIDPSTIPDAVLHSEVGRRRAAKRRTFGAGTGRPKVLKTCRRCGAECGAREFRSHRCPLPPGSMTRKAAMAAMKRQAESSAAAKAEMKDLLRRIKLMHRRPR